MSDERQAFEQAVTDRWSDSYSFTRFGDEDYYDEVVEGMWRGWQASRQGVGGQDARLIHLLADIRFACGDDGKRMQGELVEYIGELARKAGELEGEPIGFLQSSGVSQLSGGHPAKLYPIGATPSPFESSALVYTHPAISDNQAHWSQGSPGLADQYRQEAFAAREALGFSCDSLEVSPADIRQAIADKQAVRVPDVGDMADILGDWVRSTTGVSLTHVTLVDIVRVMLAAPQQPPKQEQDHE